MSDAVDVEQQPRALIRRATNGDAATLALIGSATFLETFAGVLEGADIVEHCAKQHSAAIYDAWLTNPHAAVWLASARHGCAPVGYAVLDRPQLAIADLDRETDLEIKRIYVLSRFHGTGVGAELMTAALDEAKLRGARRALLGVYSQNHRALAFYAKHGFTRIGDRQFQVGANLYFDHVLALQLR